MYNTGKKRLILQKQFLGFAWGSGKDKKYFKFLVLPFGLSTAPYVFTKVTRQLVKFWRFQGYKIVTVLDDGILSSFSECETTIVGHIVKHDLLKAGLVPKAEKSLWKPVQEIEWLGFIIDTRHMKLSIPQRKICKLKQGIGELLSSTAPVPVKSLASVVGQTVAMKMVVGTLCQLMTKFLSIQTPQASSWKAPVVLSYLSRDQLQFWAAHIDRLSKCTLCYASIPTRVVYSDASNSGCGGYCVEVGQAISHGQWSALEASRSSTWRELKAVFLVMKSFVSILESHKVKLLTDNQNVESIVSKGSMKADLQALALDIFRLCNEYNIRVDMQWIPRLDNERADYLSKIVDADDWGIQDYVFQHVSAKWGPFDVDRFASYYNTKVVRFNSRFWNPGSDGVDALSVSWGDDNNWIVPPICMTARVLKHMRECHATGTLVIPVWYPANFWPILCPNRVFIPQIKDWMYLPTWKEAYVPSRQFGGLFGVHDLKFNMMALHVEF
ncbi:uncharacterized protein [Haliotis asinina]|uniref:uncharacterized protein n=1 Tax=Haliotis asinina TaxID=109174 RepID=UPI0035322F6A